MTNPSPKRLIILDAMVFIRLLYDQLQKFPIESESNRLMFIHGCFEWMQSAAWVPLFAEHPEANITLWAMDSPPYWRKEILPSYKGGRPEKPQELLDLIQIFKESDIPQVSSPGQEADDIVASAVRQWENRREGSPFHQIFLGTIDSDWLGLIEQPGAYWLGLSRRHSPRLRGKPQAYEWLKSKWNKAPQRRVKSIWPMPEYENFRADDIWDFKSLLGEPGDGIPRPAKLPEGIDSLPLIHLHKQPAEYRLKNESWLQDAIINAAKWEPSMNPRDFEQWALSELGMIPPVEPLPLTPSMLSTEFSTTIDKLVA